MKQEILSWNTFTLVWLNFIAHVSINEKIVFTKNIQKDDQNISE